MIGHSQEIALLKSLVARDALGHGYIFYGPSMVGKKTLARSFAHFLESGIFEEPGEGTVFHDAMVIGGNGLGTGIDEVREIKKFLWQKPNTSARRTLILDDADMLTNEAQNALLKITEEPPVSSLLILITSDIDGILPTIVSRLPRMYFGSVPTQSIIDWLIEYFGLKKADATTYVSKAMGKPGLAWRLSHDVEFREQLSRAGEFLRTTSATRKDFIKKLIEPDEFNLKKFLDAVIITLAWQNPSKSKSLFWHKTMKLYESAVNFGLNPRLQLDALLK